MENTELLRKLAADYEVLWDSSPAFICEGTQEVQIGYDLELAGTHPHAGAFEELTEEQENQIFCALRAIAGILVSEVSGCRYEIDAQESEVTFWPQHKNRPDATLSIRITAGESSPRNSTAALRCLNAMTGRLRDCGVPES